MLHNIKLIAGQFITLTRRGSHINIVLAAGEITGRFNMKNGKPLQTGLVSGMAFEPGLFDSVAFRSPITQQVKIWIGDTPLNYSPETARAVGANAIQSSVGYVYSGIAEEILPAQPGRNKITMTPEKDIFIGGPNLNTQNGVKVSAGQTFSMNTQGAVHALETSGNYVPIITARAGADDFANAKAVTHNNEGLGLYGGRFVIARPKANELLTFTDNYMRRVSRGGDEYLGQIMTGVEMTGKSYMPLDSDGNGYSLAYESAYKKHWFTVNPETLEFTKEEVPHVFGKSASFAQSDDGLLRAVYTQTVGLSISEDGGEFVNSGVTLPDEGYLPWDMVIDEDKNIWCLTDNFLYKTADKGESWESFDTPVGLFGAHMLKNSLTGEFIVVSSNTAVVWSFNGAAFAPIYEAQGNINEACEMGGRFLFEADGGLLYLDDGVFTEHRYEGQSPYGSTWRILGMTTFGNMYVAYTEKALVIEGESAKVGGLPVAIMAEVN